MKLPRKKKKRFTKFLKNVKSITLNPKLSYSINDIMTTLQRIVDAKKQAIKPQIVQYKAIIVNK